MDPLEELLRLGFDVTQSRIRPNGDFVFTATWRGESVRAESADYRELTRELHSKGMGLIRRMPAVSAR